MCASGREGVVMFDDDEPPVRLIDPQRDVLIETGYGLDDIGALAEVGLLRDGFEPDDIYRSRLMGRIFAGATESARCATAPDDTTPNHVRDAIRANQ
jgi:hypothetical protein